jgi:uridine kinase
MEPTLLTLCAIMSPRRATHFALGRTGNQLLESHVPDQRQQLLHRVVDAIALVPAAGIVRVAIDGVDGAGKTHLADELAALLQSAGRTTIRASVDGFHNPQAVRYQRGRTSPEGFFNDSYDYDQLKAVLLDPLSPGGSRQYMVAIFDHRSDAPVLAADRMASVGDILLFDGIFLHRPELRGYWDYSIFLEVQFSVSIPRGAQRGEGSPDPAAPYNHRYVRGQELYLRTCEPTCFATAVINNDDLRAPYVVEAQRSTSP